MSAVLQSPETTQQPARPWEKYVAAAGGLSEYWYPVTTAKTLRGKKRMTFEVVGRKIVIFHEQGRFYALQDQCAHRQIPLSLGVIEFPKHLTCMYHGWTYSMESGRMVQTLTDGPNSPMNGKASVRTYPVEERAGLVFVWVGEGTPVPVEDDIPAELLRDDVQSFPDIRIVEGNWRHACENGFDESHVKMLHRSSLWVAFRNVSAWNDTRIENDGTYLIRVQDNVHLFDNYPGLGEWPRKHFWKPDPATGVTTGGKDHGVAIRLPGILRVKQPGKADWTHYEWYVPMNEKKYIYLVLAVTWRKSPWKRFMFWLRYWTYILWVHHYGFNNQDLGMVGATPESSPARLFRPDISIIEWRRLVEDRARPVNRGPAARGA